MAHNIFRWTAVLTWILILGGSFTYVGLRALNVIYNPPQAIEKIQDRFPHRVAFQVANGAH
jgi:hypothetical protein